MVINRVVIGMRRCLTYILPVIILLILLMSFICDGQAAYIEIKIPAQVTVYRQDILLGDIAEIKGFETGHLAEIKLAKSPLPGYSREISRDLISLLLQDHGYSLTEIKLKMPASVIVETASRKIDPEQLFGLARKYVVNSLPYGENRLKIEAGFNPAEITIPDSDYSLQIAQNVKMGNLIGSVSLPVEILIGGKLWKRVYLGLKITLISDVFVAKRNIKRGEKVVQEDFAQETRELTKLRGELITDWNHPLVKLGVFNVPLARGEILTSDYLQKPIVVRWGDEVQAEIIVGNVRVSTMVVVRQSGRIGDYVLVENFRNGYKFKALVINAHLVQLIRS